MLRKAHSLSLYLSLKLADMTENQKKKNFLRFRKHLENWINFLAGLEENVKDILKDGPIDFSQYPFGQQPYRIHSLCENLYCHKAYLDDNGLICIDASETEEGFDKGYVLSWDDMTQDAITLSDFMDCIYGNENFKYEK